MSEIKSTRQRKRPLNNEEEEETICKRRRDEGGGSREAINGLLPQRVEKSPRLSTALFCDNCEIQHHQLHQLLKYAAIGKGGSATQASWCTLHHQKRLRGVMVVVLQDLAQHHFYQYYSHFHSLRRLFKHRFSMPPPTGDFTSSLLGLDVTDQKENMDDQRNPEGSELTNSPDPTQQKYGTSIRGLTRYLLTEEEMRNNDFPFIGSSDTENYIHTNCSEEPTDNSPLFGLDCEMCMTCKGHELTRVSLVDAQGKCIMDELVKPYNPIINYMTRFSGITKKKLHPVKTKLKDIQEKIKDLLPPNAVLVGHSLNNDLRALQMIHPNVIDTSLLFAPYPGRRFKLKFLAQVILKREIQCGDAGGHNPSEDATATLNLAQYFIQNGPEKVADINLEDIFLKAKNLHSTPGDTKSSEIKPNGMLHPLPSEGPSFLEKLEKAGRKIAYVSRDSLRNPVSSRQVETLLCASNEEILEKVCSVVPLSPVSIVKFQHGSIPNKLHVAAKEVTCKFGDMMTVFAGPFRNGVCLRSVKMHFGSCGPILSLSAVSGTHQPYVCIKYGVPEAAQLAVELLNGSCIDGSPIKVQRMVSGRTLDYEDICKEMGEDPENENTIYVSGFANPLTEEFLQNQFTNFKEIKSIFVPTNPNSRRQAKYCYLRFHSPDAAAAAVRHIQAHGGLRSMKAVTSCHFHRWLQTAVRSVPPLTSQEIVSREPYTEIIRDLDRKVLQLYESLLENTLCVIVFPGNNSSGPLPGFGVIGIKS
ncbi:RNA exonuclease 5 isoform X2 [Phyllobates terribilis]|uniref:RNA exonuclease 5 isoform X2 n=1 Tax=Phyllobates terribilis TaxID=111132 RepID=UPI003CCB00D8